MIQESVSDWYQIAFKYMNDSKRDHGLVAWIQWADKQLKNFKMVSSYACSMGLLEHIENRIGYRENGDLWESLRELSHESRKCDITGTCKDQRIGRSSHLAKLFLGYFSYRIWHSCFCLHCSRINPVGADQLRLFRLSESDIGHDSEERESMISMVPLSRTVLARSLSMKGPKNARLQTNNTGQPRVRHDEVSQVLQGDLLWLLSSESELDSSRVCEDTAVRGFFASEALFSSVLLQGIFFAARQLGKWHYVDSGAMRSYIS